MIEVIDKVGERERSTQEPDEGKNGLSRGLRLEEDAFLAGSGSAAHPDCLSPGIVQGLGIHLVWTQAQAIRELHEEKDHI